MKKIFVYILLFSSLGCFAQKKILNKIKMCELLTEMKNSDQLHRQVLIDLSRKKEKNYQRKVDSVWKYQLKIDIKNTEKLIELTKEYGWISNDRTDCPELNIWLIFRHSQEDYFEEIGLLIDKELNAGRLSPRNHMIINDQLNGRPGF